MSRLVLITRPEEDSLLIADLVKEKNYDVVTEPFLKVILHDQDLTDLESYQGLIFTSTNGVRAFCQNSNRRDYSVFAVGDQTMDEAKRVGFNDIKSAQGNVDDLIDLLSSQNSNGPYLHIRGEHVTRPLIEASDTIQIDEKILYHTEKIEEISSGSHDLLSQEAFSDILFFSRRTAEAFTEYVQAQGLEDRLKRTKALCLGPSMVQCLSVLSWQDVVVAAHPNRDGILALLD